LLRKLWTAVTVAAMVLAYAGTAGAAPQQKPIQVLLNGKPVQFAVSPAAIDGRTFVEFRSLFCALGYKVAYDPSAKKITATSDGHTIEITIGADKAFVDGQAVAVDGQLRLVDNRTLVGVKFIAELSGKDVSWDAATKTVVMKDSGPTAGQQAAVFAFLDRMLAAEAASSADATLALIADDSPLRSAVRQDLAERLQRVQTKTTIMEKHIDSYSPKEAKLTTVEETVKVGGDGFYPNRRSETTYTLHPDANGEWKLYNLQLNQVVYTNVTDLFTQEADIPDDEKAALRAVIDRQIQAAARKDLDAYMATMYFDDDQLKETVASQVKQVFTAYDSTMTIDRFVVVDYYDSDKATVLFEATTEVKMAGRTVKARTVIANDAEKRDGKWLLDPIATQLSSEPL